MSNDTFPLAYQSEEANRYFEFEKQQHPADTFIADALRGIGIHGHKILDYGCGSGLMVPPLLKLGASQVIGCDPSAAMIREANRRFAGASAMSAMTRFDLLTGLPLPYPSSSFDGVLLRFVLHYIPDTQSAFREFARILKPNGWVVAVSSDVSLKPGREYLANTMMPLIFQDMLTVRTLIKQGKEITESAGNAGLEIERYERISDATLASVDTTYEHAREIEQFSTGLLVARKPLDKRKPTV
ncbi:MAG: class I SAM-dependent methyltransferase [bacterium]